MIFQYKLIFLFLTENFSIGFDDVSFASSNRVLGFPVLLGP